MSFLLYVATAASLLWLCHRFVRPLSLLAALLLALLPFCLTGFALITDRVYGPIDFAYVTEPLLQMRGQYNIDPMYNGILSDISCQMIPWRKAVQWTLGQREWPIYNPFILSGDILAAAAQPAAYSPFTLIACLLPVAKSLTYSASIALFVAGLGAFLFAREIGCREVAALIGAAAFMYSAAIAFFILWPLAFSWTFLPAVLLGVRRVVYEPGLRSITILTIAFSLLLLAGHPETAFHVVFIGGLYAILELVRHRAHGTRSIGAGLAGGVLALLICAIYVLPILEAAPQTAEHIYRKLHYSKAPRGVHHHEVLARVATDIFPFLHTRKWLVPTVPNLPFDSAAVGSVALAAAVYAIWRVRSAYTWFFLCVALFGLLTHAEWGPLTRTLQKLPLFDITLNERFSFAAAFALAILAALGVEELCRRSGDRAFAFTCAALLVALTIGTEAIMRNGIVGPNMEMWGDYKIAMEIGALAIAALVVLFRVPAPTAAAILLGMILLQRTASEKDVYDVFPAEAAYPPVPVFEKLKPIREPFRITGIWLTFIPGMNTLYELEDVRGYEAMTFNRYTDTYPLWCVVQLVWFNRVDDLTRPFLSFLNTRFAVVPERYPIPDGWRDFAMQRGTRILENTRVLERAFVPRSVRLGVSPQDAVMEMSKETDFRERAWIETPDEKPHLRTNGPGLIAIHRKGPRQYELDAEMKGSGWIVISQAAWEGWRAYLDGRRVKTHFANVAFLSVFVPQGSHRVRLVYLPDSFVRGRAITFATLGIILVGTVTFRLRRKLA